MRPRELPYRLRQLLTRAIDPRLRPPPTPAGPPPRWPAPLDTERDPDVVRALGRGWRTHGARVRPATRARWTRDPVTGRHLPDGWNVDALAVGFDPRPTWELHRLQHLALWSRLAPTAPEPWREARAWLTRWTTGRGLPWASALEAAFRIPSLVLLAHAHPAAELRTAVHQHAWWVARHPSRGSSEGNHTVGELAALALAARALPDLTDAPRWADAATELPGVLSRLLTPDGSGVEQSPSYLAVTLEWALLARACGVDGLDDALRRGGAYLATLLDEGGRAPRIGDDDGGRVLAPTVGPEPRYVRSVAGACAVATGEPAPPGWVPDLRSRTLGLPDAVGRAARPSRMFGDGGLTVLRRPGRLLVFDHGPAGHPPLCAHGHADALAVWLHLGGRPVLVGRGTPTYTGVPSVRRAFRSTRAHNTVVLGGRDAAEPSAHPFLWDRTTAGVLDHARLAEHEVEAHHDGYRILGVRHRRRVRDRDRSITLEDRLEGRGRHHVAVLLHLAPDLRVDEGGQVSAPAGPLMRIEVPDGLVLRVERGGRDPVLGWHSPAYGERVPAPTVVLEGVVALPVRLRTVLHLDRGLWYDPSEGVVDGRGSDTS